MTCKHSGRPLRVAAFGLVEEYCVFFAEEHYAELNDIYYLQMINQTSKLQSKSQISMK
jgi:hypothetical protein